MSMGKYAAFYGSIGFVLMQVVGIHQEHDFAIVDEASYRGWKLLDDFVDESCETFVDRNGQERTRRKANFQDKHHRGASSPLTAPIRASQRSRHGALSRRSSRTTKLCHIPKSASKNSSITSNHESKQLPRLRSGLFFIHS